MVKISARVQKIKSDLLTDPNVSSYERYYVFEEVQDQLFNDIRYLVEDVKEAFFEE